MTTPIGFPPQRSQALLRNLLTDLRGAADVRREEAVTGRLADPALALGGRISEPLGIERALADIAEYRQSIALAETRAGATQIVLGEIAALVDDLANQTQLGLQSATTGGLETVAAVAEDGLIAAVSALNTRVGGRSVFAGDDGDQPALASAATIRAEVVTILEAAPDAATAEADLTIAFNAAGGLFETTLYGGGAGDAPAAEIAPGERVAHQTKADAPAIRDVLRAVATLSAAYAPDTALAPADRERLAEAALATLRNSVDPLNRLRAEIGSAEARIETVRARQVAEETALTAQYNAFTGADTLVAATELQAVEGQLEILFLTTARLSGLSLVNFLR